jgi:hypothetical protein
MPLAKPIDRKDLVERVQLRTFSSLSQSVRQAEPCEAH